LHGVCQFPPLLRCCVLADPSHVLFESLADVFIVREKFTLPKKYRVVPDARIMNALEHTWKGVFVKNDVPFLKFRSQSDQASKPLCDL
jgi:hypothetical protein